jgi:hypothetical protein
MTRRIGRLTALFVKKQKTPGLFGDGGNLYLQITNANARSWIFRYGNRYAGLGSAFNVTLEEARDLAYECRKMLREGVDPLEVRRTKQAQARLEAAKAISFRHCATAYIEAHRAAWRDAKHHQQWNNTIEQHCGLINDLPVQSVDTEGVLAVLQPIWATIPESASRIRGRIEAVLDWAKVRGYRTGENPARWRGHLDKLLPKLSRVRKVVHHAALPYSEVPAFIAKLRQRERVTSKALEFAILTAARSGEVLGAKRDEFDLDAAVWTVPAERMKGGNTLRLGAIVAAFAIRLGILDKDSVLLEPLDRIGVSAATDFMRDQIKHSAADFVFVIVEGALRQIDRDRAVVAKPQFVRRPGEACIGLAEQRNRRRLHIRGEVNRLLRSWHFRGGGVSAF